MRVRFAVVLAVTSAVTLPPSPAAAQSAAALGVYQYAGCLAHVPGLDLTGPVACGTATAHLGLDPAGRRTLSVQSSITLHAAAGFGAYGFAASAPGAPSFRGDLAINVAAGVLYQPQTFLVAFGDTDRGPGGLAADWFPLGVGVTLFVPTAYQPGDRSIQGLPATPLVLALVDDAAGGAGDAGGAAAVTVTPEPSTYGLLGTGLAALGLLARRRSRSA